MLTDISLQQLIHLLCSNITLQGTPSLVCTTPIVDYQPTCNSVTPSPTRLTLHQNLNRSLSSKRTVCVRSNLTVLAKHKPPWHRHPMSPRLFFRTSALMRRWTMVVIPILLVKRRQRPTHQCKMQGLILHLIDLPSVAEPTRRLHHNKPTS